MYPLAMEPRDHLFRRMLALSGAFCGGAFHRHPLDEP